MNNKYIIYTHKYVSKIYDLALYFDACNKVSVGNTIIIYYYYQRYKEKLIKFFPIRVPVKFNY